MRKSSPEIAEAADDRLTTLSGRSQPWRFSAVLAQLDATIVNVNSELFAAKLHSSLVRAGRRYAGHPGIERLEAAAVSAIWRSIEKSGIDVYAWPARSLSIAPSRARSNWPIVRNGPPVC